VYFDSVLILNNDTQRIQNLNNKKMYFVEKEKINMINTVLFDLDGTLTDPKMGITRSVQYSLAKYGIHIENLDELEPFIGPPLKESFMKYFSFSESDALQAIDYYREYFSATGLYENEVYPGIPGLLETLQAKGLILAVATSKPTVFAEKILAHFKLDRYFAEIAGSNLDNTRTDKKEVIEYALSRLNRINTEAVMIGDRKHDIMGAQACGVQSIGVLYGYGDRSEIELAKPHDIAENVTDLDGVLNRITSG